MPKNLFIQLPTKAIRNVLYGLIIGIACVTPGLSGGVIAAAAGIYEPALYAIVNARNQCKRSSAYLIPLGIGTGLGVLLFSQIMKQLMANAEHAVLYAFIGMVLGSVPALVRESNRDGFKPQWLIASATGLGVALLSGPALAGLAQNADSGRLTGVNGLLAGGVFAFGTVIPGISASFILMAMGLYEQFLAAVADFQIISLIWIGAGFVATALATVKLVEWLFRVCRGPAYYAVIGLLLGSMAVAFPGAQTGWRLTFDLALLLGGAAASWAVMRMQHSEA